MNRDNHDRPTRTRVRASSSLGGRLVALAVGLGALLLVGMVIAGSIKPPAAAPQARATASPQPAPSPTAVAADRMYLLKQRVIESERRAVSTLQAIDTASNQLLFTLDNVNDAAVSADGGSIYTLHDKTLVAYEADSLRERWRMSLSSVGGFQANWIPLAKLALAPDGGTVFLYRHAFQPNSSQTHAWIERINTGDGAHNGPPIDLPMLSSNPQLALAADQRSLFVLDSTNVTVVDLETGASRIMFSALSGTFVAALSPNGKRLYIATGSRMVTLDAVSQQELDSFTLGGINVPSGMVVSPDGKRIAMLVATLAPPTILEGSQVVNASGQSLILVDAANGRVVGKPERPDDAWIEQPVFNSAGTEIYFVEQAIAFRWDLAADRVEQFAFIDNSPVSRLIVSAYVPFTGSQPAAIPPDEHITAQATPTPLLQADDQPFAWLWPTIGGSGSVTAFSRDGSRRIIADQVIDIISRSGQPPLLLRATQTASGGAAWSIVDPISERMTPLSLAVGPDSAGLPDDPLRFALSPDGARLAFVTHSDPDPTDERAAPRQLVVIELGSGEFRIVSDAAVWDQLYYGRLLTWAAEGLYLASTLEELSIGEDLRALWLIDPEAAEPTPQQIFSTPTKGANIELNAAAGLLLYEAYDNDTVTGTLHLVNLRNGAETLINENGTFVDRYMMKISPDGAHVAYVRLDREGYASRLMLYRVADGSEAALQGEMRGGPLRWLPDGSLYLEQLLYGQRLSLTWRMGPEGPIAIDQQSLPADIDMAGAQVLDGLDDRGLIGFGFNGSEGWLKLYEPGDPLRAAVALPLTFNLTDQDGADISLRTRIVYLP